MITMLILSGLWGMGIGVLGGMLKWPKALIYTLAFAGGLIISLLYVQDANSDETLAYTRLRATTLHIDVGSGSVVKAPSGKTYLLTNSHVCMASKWKGEMSGVFPDGRRLHGPVVKNQLTRDLCAARVMNPPDSLKIGGYLYPMQQIYTRGYPEHILTESAGRASYNIHWAYDFPISDVGECPPGSKKERDLNDKLYACGMEFDSTLTNLYSRPGSSGSPVVDNDGNIVGVVSSWHPTNAYEAGIVTFKDLKNFLSDL